MSATPSPRDERIARVSDREVAPLWHDRFATMLWRHLPRDPVELVLDVHCGSGRTTEQLLQRLAGAPRIVGLEPDASLRELAKLRLAADKERSYVMAGELGDLTRMPAQTYDLVVANLVLGETAGRVDALRELLRVVKPGGRVLATLPLHGSWSEPQDLYREVLRDAQLDDAARRLNRVAALQPTGPELARAMAELRVFPHHFVIEQERFELLFAGGREFLFAPVVELGPLRLWKAVLGQHHQPQQLFWRLKEAIDTYFSHHVFSVTINMGLLHLRVPGEGIAAAHAAAETSGEYWRQWPHLDALWQTVEQLVLSSSSPENPLEFDVDMDAQSSGSAPRPMAGVDLSDRPLPAEMSQDGALGDVAGGPDDLFDAAEQAAAEQRDLDALLDRVFEYVNSGDDDDDLEVEPELIDPDSPGQSDSDTLQRIRALLPPPIDDDDPESPPDTPPKQQP